MATEQTWYTDVDVAFSDSSTVANAARSYIWGFVKLLKGTASGTSGANGARPSGSLWTVAGSSDGSTAGMDGTDRWTTIANIVNANAGSAHSWIVLSPPGGSGLPHILVSADSTTTTNYRISASYGAYTGGSITADPTSATSRTLAQTAIADTSVSVLTHRVHMVRNAAGEFHCFFNRQGDSAARFYSHIWCRRAGTAIPGTDTYPGVFAVTAWGTSDTTYTTWALGTGASGNALMFSPTTGAVVSSTFGQVVTSDAQTSMTLPNTITGLYEFYGISAFGNTSGFVGKRGRFYDFFFVGQPNALAQGGDFAATPGAATEYVRISSFALPLDVKPSV